MPRSSRERWLVSCRSRLSPAQNRHRSQLDEADSSGPTFVLSARKVYDIEDCRLIRLRYRQDSRCFLLYTLRLVEPDTGRERDVQVTGLIYAEKDKAEQTWRKLKATDPQKEIPDGWLTFEPVSFVPELDMLVQVFPYDHRLPTLPLLAAGPPPELEPVLLGRFGPGEWRVQAWNTEPVRYLDRGVVLRYTAKSPKRCDREKRREKLLRQGLPLQKGRANLPSAARAVEPAGANGEALHRGEATGLSKRPSSSHPGGSTRDATGRDSSWGRRHHRSGA